MDYLHVKNLEKYHPGYKDRELQWCKTYFKMINADPEFEMLNEVDKWRFVAFVMLELQIKNPIPLNPEYLTKKGFNLEKFPISNTLQMLHSFVEIVTEEKKLCVLEKNKNKNKRREDKDNISIFQQVLDIWNKQRENGRWKTHTKLTPDIISAVRKNLVAHWTVEDICAAIDNFAKIVQGKGYKWTYAKWGLVEFLTRGQKDDKGLRWLWFHPNNFVEDDWLTDETRQKRAEQQAQYGTDIQNADEGKLIDSYKINRFGLNWLIDKLRPEIKENFYKAKGDL